MTTSKGARAGAAKRSSKTGKKKAPRKSDEPPLFTAISAVGAGGADASVCAYVYALDVCGHVWRFTDNLYPIPGHNVWERL